MHLLGPPRTSPGVSPRPVNSSFHESRRARFAQPTTSSSVALNPRSSTIPRRPPDLGEWPSRRLARSRIDAPRLPNAFRLCLSALCDRCETIVFHDTSREIREATARPGWSRQFGESSQLFSIGPAFALFRGRYDCDEDSNARRQTHALRLLSGGLPRAAPADPKDFLNPGPTGNGDADWLS